jgi:L-malate glycosyltransferase
VSPPTNRKRNRVVKPRVLTLFPSAVGGGAERLVLEQMRHYDRAAYEYSVVALRRGSLHTLFGEHPEYSCARALATFNPWVLWRLLRLVRRRGIQLLHTHLQEADFYGYLLKRMEPGLTWVSTRHNTDDFRTRWFWRTLNRKMGRRLDHVIAVSGAVSEFVQRHEAIPADKIEVVLNGVDLAPFDTAPDRVSARRALGLAESDFVVGVVGRLCHQKGHRYLLEAAALIRDQVPGLVVLLAGQGGLRRQLERLAHTLGIGDRVRFLGFRRDVAAVYRALDVFCLPSVFEGFGLVLAEAMAAGCPAIGTRVHGIVEVIDHERNGLLVKPCDPAELAAAILRVHRHEVDADMAARARADAHARFDVRRTMKTVEGIYLRMLGAQ